MTHSLEWHILRAKEKKKKSQRRILYPVKLFFKNEG